MKTYYIIFLIFIVNKAFSQKSDVYKILSRKDSTVIARAHIKIDDHKIIISDSLGCFFLNKFDNIKISCVGYKEEILNRNQLIGNDIYLEEKVNLLKDVILISSKKLKNKIIYPKESIVSKFGYFKGHSTRFNSEYLTFVKNDKYETNKIRKILIQIDKGYWKEKNSGFLPFEVNLFSVDSLSDLPLSKMIVEDIYVDSKFLNGDVVEIDVSDYNLDFSHKGLFIAVKIFSVYDYQKMYPLNVNSPIFKIIKKTKKDSFTLSRWYDSNNNIIKDWKDNYLDPLHFVFKFGLLIER